ncbi:MAG: DUF86 domain-containing protein [Candidatus Altiarchaeota archaeon]
MKEEISAKLEMLRKYVTFLKSKRGVTLAELKRDDVLLAALERNLQVALECCLEMGEMVISNEGLRKPDSYRDVIKILGEAGVLEKDFSKRFEPAAGLRNLLVHNYSEIDASKIHSFVRNRVGDFDEYARQIAQHVRGHKK